MKYELYRDKHREFRWHLKTRNGRLLADSGEGYRSKQGCLKALGLVRTGARSAKLDDLTVRQ